MLVIILFIFILNVVSILLMYRCLTNVVAKEKLIFIAAGTALMYIFTSVIYWISTRSIEITEVSQKGKDLIIFAFVPVNGILILPLFAKSFSKFKGGSIDSRILRNRGIVLAVILASLLTIECVYFKNIQEQVVKLIMENEDNTEYNQDSGNINELGNENSNMFNDIENQIVVNTVNDITNENITNENVANENVVSDGSTVNNVNTNVVVNSQVEE